MITGIILAGGKSSRMGKDKCLVEFNQKKLIEYTIEVFKPITDKIILSTNKTEHSRFGYVTVKDEYIDCGAIGGIHSALKFSNSKINIISPCDMPFLSADLFRFLIDNKEGFDVVVPIFNGKVEPLTGIYSKNILPTIENQIKQKTYKILSFLEKVKTNFIEINSSLPFYCEKLFTNINYLKDLKNL